MVNFGDGILKTISPGWPLNLKPPDLRLSSSYNYRHEPPVPGLQYLIFKWVNSLLSFYLLPPSSTLAPLVFASAYIALPVHMAHALKNTRFKYYPPRKSFLFNPFPVHLPYHRALSPLHHSTFHMPCSSYTYELIKSPCTKMGALWEQKFCPLCSMFYPWRLQQCLKHISIFWMHELRGSWCGKSCSNISPLGFPNAGQCLFLHGYQILQCHRISKCCRSLD
jgi:hypothetical protein